jgi:type IV secretion system protein VirB1
MDATALMVLAAMCAPLVHPDTALAIALTESALNPNAIGVVAARLERQPRNLPEALMTAAALRAQQRNFSVGLAQINVHNLERLGLRIEDAFDGCKNLAAMQVVLGECFDRAEPAAAPQTALRQALSCYYSGNLTTGFRHGYVSRVVGHARQSARAPP